MPDLEEYYSTDEDPWDSPYSHICAYKRKLTKDLSEEEMNSKVHVDESEYFGVEEAQFEHKDVRIKKDRWVTAEFRVSEELLGKGKFGEVKQCRELRSGRVLAAKFIDLDGLMERSEILNEVEMMSRLQHPRLLQLYAAYENKKQICLVTELITGGELFERVINDDFILTEKACIVFMRQICEGVAFMHKMSIVHLDLKPENILCMSREGNRIKIIDFGLAKEFKPKDDLRVMFGTPEFTAPEVVNFDKITLATDLWSVGVICYVLEANGCVRVIVDHMDEPSIARDVCVRLETLRADLVYAKQGLLWSKRPTLVRPQFIGWLFRQTRKLSFKHGCAGFLGLSPFVGRTDNQTLCNVTMGKWDFEAEEFDDISKDGKAFISALLIKDQKKRLSAQEGLDHTWLRRSIKRTYRPPERSLSKKKLKRFVFRRKWQKAVNAMLALKRMGVNL